MMKTLLMAIAFSFAPLCAASAEPVHFVTEEYAPFNYKKDGEIVGIAVEQVHAIARAAAIDYTIDIMPWARAIALAESQPMHCAFITGYNRERGPRFVWISPLLKDEMLLIKRKGSTVQVKSLIEARALRVGSQRGDFAVEALEQIGFTDIDLAADIDITLRKLLSDRIDIMPTSLKTFQKLANEGQPVEKVLMLAGQTYGIACNKDMPAEIVEKLQTALDALILEGGQDRIFTAYGLPPNTRTADVHVKK
jgi:polar amino acid transport system substrate-binding protein